MSDKTLPPIKHQCGTCGAIFDSLVRLQAHVHQHLRERAQGKAAESETRRTGSRTGSNVSPAKEGGSANSEGAIPARAGTQSPTPKKRMPPDHP
jgi:hypothetical protein